VLVEGHDLQTDESLLTGESVPVRKIARSGEVASEPRRPGGDDLPYVFSGSLVMCGTGVGEVLATGVLSEIGKIGQSLSTMDTEPSRLQAQAAGAVLRHRRGRGQRPGGAALRHVSWRLARCAAGRHRDWHGDAARGIAGHPHKA